MHQQFDHITATGTARIIYSNKKRLASLERQLRFHRIQSSFPHLKKHKKMYTHTHTFNSPFSRTTWVGRYQKGTTNLDFTEARDSEWQWHQLGCMQVCTSLQTDNHASTPPLSFSQARCPSCHPTNSVKALKAQINEHQNNILCIST